MIQVGKYVIDEINTLQIRNATTDELIEEYDVSALFSQEKLKSSKIYNLSDVYNKDAKNSDRNIDGMISLFKGELK